MTPTRLLWAITIVLIVGISSSAQAGWTGSLGRYSRTLEQVRHAEYEAQIASGGTYRTGNDWASGHAATGYALPYYGDVYARDYPYPSARYFRREYLFYLDRMNHWDYRHIEWRVRQLLHHPFPRHGYIQSNLRSPDFYIQHRWLERHLERRQYHRSRYGRYRNF